VLDRLERRVARAGLSKSPLAERYIDEGIRVDEHPGIVFRDGPAGHRPGLAAGPEVWEVSGVLGGAPERGESAILYTADYLNLTSTKGSGQCREVRGGAGANAQLKDGWCVSRRRWSGPHALRVGEQGPSAWSSQTSRCRYLGPV
jgi:hypothetical protein